MLLTSILLSALFAGIVATLVTIAIEKLRLAEKALEETNPDFALQLCSEALSVAGAMSGGEQQPAPPQEVQQQQAPVQSVNNCAVDQQNFIQCLNANQGSVDACQFYFDSLNACQKGQSGFA